MIKVQISQFRFSQVMQSLSPEAVGVTMKNDS